MAASSNPEFQAETIKPYKEQQPFIWDRDKRYYGFVSGSGAGKTVAGVARTELNAEEWNQGAMGAIIAPTTRMIKNNIIPVMRKFGYLSDWEYKSTHSDEPGIHLGGPDGGRVLLLSASDERTIEYLNGLSLAYIWMDEHRDIPPRATEIAIQRLRAGDYRNMYITTTPRGFNHTYDFFVGDHEATERAWGEATIYNTEDRLCVTGVPSYANPYTPQDYKDALDSDLPEEIRAQEVQGEFVEIGSGVFSRDMLTYIAPEDAQDKRLSTIIAVDPAVTADAHSAESQDSDYWALVVVQAHRAHGKIYVSDYQRRRGMSLQEGVQWISQVASSAGDCSVVVEANQSQRWLSQALRDNGIGTQPVQSSRNKENRLIDLSVPLENDTIQFVDWSDDESPGKYYDDLISELLAFPEGHDDLIDALWLAADNSQVALGADILSFDPFSNDND